MYAHRNTLMAQETYSWKWNLMPLLIVTVALSGLFLPHGNADTDADAAAAAAAEPTSVEAPPVTMALQPSPQPGFGEPELRAEDLPQSY